MSCVNVVRTMSNVTELRSREKDSKIGEEEAERWRQ